MASEVVSRFDDIGIAAIVHQYRLVVPPNQREYSWREQEVTRLFTDLAQALSESEQYFLGTVVTVPAGPGVLEIVDGQQRLATTSILLAEMRNYLRSLRGTADRDLANYIDATFLRTYVPAERVHRPKLSLNLDDNQFFRGMLEADIAPQRPEPTHRSHKKLVKAFDLAADHVRSIVKQYDAKDHETQLAKWQAFLEQDAIVLLLEVPDAPKAYRMFETLNDRGLKTSQADMVKNYLFEQAEPARHTEVAQKWSYMRGALEAVEDEDLTVTFIRHALIATARFLREDDVLQVVQVLAKGPANSIRLLQQFEDLSRVYAALFNPESEQWDGYPKAMHRALEVMMLLDIKPLRPLMLAVASTFTATEASKAFNHLISLGIRLIIASSTRSESVEKPLAIAAKNVYDHQVTLCSELRQALKDVWPSDDLFRREFAEATVSKPPLARYYLRSLELGYHNDPEPQFIPSDDGDVISLEHVLPEKPQGNWPQFDAEETRYWTRRVGNLALLKKSENSDLRSADFESKRAVYAGSGYTLTHQISNLDHWTKDEIAGRQATLAGLAVKVWNGK